MVSNLVARSPEARLTAVLKSLEIATSSWYRAAVPCRDRQRPGPKAKPLAQRIVRGVVQMAETNPWYGYKRIAVMCRRAGICVKDRWVYRIMRDAGLLQKRRCRKPELYQAAKLFELLPQRPNDLWQMDVTYVHIPGYGWYYAVTVIDYYSRYLLACHLTSSYSALEVIVGLSQAEREAERIHGRLERKPFLVTDNGPSFIAGRFQEYLTERFAHVRIRYRTPTQLGVLERFHETLKSEEIYWRLYDNPAHARECLLEFKERYNRTRPHWALVPEGGGDPLVPAEVFAGNQSVGIPRWQPWARAAQAKLETMMDAA